MFLRIAPLLCLFYFLNAQIALPTFQAVQKPHSASSSSGPFTFTNCGATGKSGPTQSDCNSEYSGTSLDGNVTVSSGIQTWTVPSSGTYTIEVWGADGGGYNGGTVVNTNSYNNAYLNYGAGSFTADNASSIVDIGTNDGVGKVVITKN